MSEVSADITISQSEPLQRRIRRIPNQSEKTYANVATCEKGVSSDGTQRDTASHPSLRHVPTYRKPSCSSSMNLRHEPDNAVRRSKNEIGDAVAMANRAAAMKTLRSLVITRGAHSVSSLACTLRYMYDDTMSLDLCHNLRRLCSYALSWQ